MKVTAKIDKLGRVVIPIGMRKKLRLFEGCILYLSSHEDRLILEKKKLGNRFIIEGVLRELMDEFHVSFIVANENEVELSLGKYGELEGKKISADLLLLIEFSENKDISEVKVADKVIKDKMHIATLQGENSRGCLIIVGETSATDFIIKIVRKTVRDESR